ncbi:MAG: metallophosphoesterase [Myxococcales bacterium]|nr:metallophosphoesterase [Myxococcota bacterium]MDW8283191.1 metallophosphoesterase [Myxococcales bacterium]
MLRELVASYRRFAPAETDPDPGRDALLLRPRLGYPAVVQAGAPFVVEVLERGRPAPWRAVLTRPNWSAEQAARCLQGEASRDGCHALELLLEAREAIADNLRRVRLSARPLSLPPPGGYDLYFASGAHPPERAPHAVWLLAQDPTLPRPLRVVQLSDIHIGKRHQRRLEQNLERVLADVNALRPDVVLITGDVVDRGGNGAQLRRAQQMLLRIQAPLLVVPGNHDHGFGPKALFGTGSSKGYLTFARGFHPYPLFTVTLGGWDFIGFDSGPSVPSFRILTRGLLPETLERMRSALDRARQKGRRGVVLFSHAPPRAHVLSSGGRTGRGFFGRMRTGAQGFEQLLLDGAAAGLRVLHLSGHTHWADLHEARPGPRGLRFERWPARDVSPCPREIAGLAALITAQAAAHTTFAWRRNGRGHGFVRLELDGERAQVAFPRYGVREPGCSEVLGAL